MSGPHSKGPVAANDRAPKSNQTRFDSATGVPHVRGLHIDTRTSVPLRLGGRQLSALVHPAYALDHGSREMRREALRALKRQAAAGDQVAKRILARQRTK